MADLLTRATLERPKEIKDRAAQRYAQGVGGGEVLGWMDGWIGKAIGSRWLVSSCLVTTTGTQEGPTKVLSGSPPTVFVADKAGAARIDMEGKG